MFRIYKTGELWKTGVLMSLCKGRDVSMKHDEFGRVAPRQDAAAGCSSMWADILRGECCCGNLLWQSSLTLLPSAQVRVDFRGKSDIHAQVCGDIRCESAAQNGVIIWYNLNVG